MAIALHTPDTTTLATAVDALRDWQSEGAPTQLHPGDLGWFHRFGPQATAAAVRTWSRRGHLLAIGLLDGPDLLRLTTAPDARQDEELAQHLATDLNDPTRGVLPMGRVNLEAPLDALIQHLLPTTGWAPDEPWTPLHRDLTPPVEPPPLRIEVAGPPHARTRADLQRAAFDKSTFTPDHWHTMATAPPYTDARCLIAYHHDTPVAAVTVWSAGPGKPGLLEPMGVHRNHRGRGHGKAITTAAAATLRTLGASSALVCTPTSNTAAIATYKSAGFTELPQVRDLSRTT